MIGALLYLRVLSLWNRLRTSAQRVREPKYLAGMIAAAAYLYYLIIRPMGRAPLPGWGADGGPARGLAVTGFAGFPAIAAAILFLLVLGRQALAWIAPPYRSGLRFSEAEIAFLFPAPLSRRALVHFNLIGSQLRILLSSLILSLLFSGGGGRLGHAVGWWVVLSALSLHSTGVGLVVARRAGTPDRAPRGRNLALAILGLILAAAVWEFFRNYREPEAAELSDPGGIGSYLGGRLDAGFLHGLLLPFRWITGPFLAATPSSFFLSLGPALAVLLVLYLWIARLEAPFEEVAIVRAQTRARLLRAGGAPGTSASARTRSRREPFRLGDGGRPETAFLWKNLLAIRFNPRLLLLAVFFAASLASATLGRPRQGLAVLVLVAAVAVASYTLLVGPQLLRQDLRGDLANADILKAYPLAGWQVLTGEILTPTAILSGLLWLALVAAAWALGRIEDAAAALGTGQRLVLCSCACAVVPPLCALQLIVPNGAALLFPGWFRSSGSRGGGFEAMGQRLIFAFGQWLAAALALLPAVLLAGGVFLAGRFWLGLLLPDEAAGAAATIAATAAALAILVAELGTGLWWLGTRFEKLDLSSDPQT